MKYLLFIVLTFYQLSAFANDPQKNLAIVIGNSDYKTVGKLNNPVNDATLISDRLRKIGFEVKLQKNLDELGFKKIIKELSRNSENYNATLVYYAGHAVQLSGQNYLLPVNQEAPQTEEDIKLSAVLMEDLQNSIKSPLKIIFLDACRDNPLIQSSMNSKGRGLLSRGLAIPNSSGSSFIAYATESGKVAIDGEGKNSPFALALSDNLMNQESIDDMFSKVTKQVLKVTSGSQRPYKYASLEEKFCLVGVCQNEASKQINPSISINLNIEKEQAQTKLVKIKNELIPKYADWVTYTFNDDYIYQFSPSSFEYNSETGIAKIQQRGLSVSKGLSRLFTKTSDYAINSAEYDCNKRSMVFTGVANFKRDGTLVNAYTYKPGEIKAFDIVKASIGEAAINLFCGSIANSLNSIPNSISTVGLVPTGTDNFGSYWWNQSGKIAHEDGFLYGVFHKLNSPYKEEVTQELISSQVIIAFAKCSEQNKANIIYRYLVNRDNKIISINRDPLEIAIEPNSPGANIFKMDCS